MKKPDLQSALQNIPLPKAPRELKWKIFGKLCVRILAKWRRRILDNLFFNLFTPMKKLAVVLPVLAVLIGGWTYLSFGALSYQDYLARANKALVQLQDISQGNTVASGPSFEIIPTAYADEDEVDEALVAELVLQVTAATEEAIELAEDLGDPAEIQAALEEIDAVQDVTITVFAEVIQVVGEPDTINVIITATGVTQGNIEEIEEALETVKAALEAEEVTVVIDIKTTIDEEEAEKEAEKAQKKIDKALEKKEKIIQKII